MIEFTCYSISEQRHGVEYYFMWDKETKNPKDPIFHIYIRHEYGHVINFRVGDVLRKLTKEEVGNANPLGD